MNHPTKCVAAATGLCLCSLCPRAVTQYSINWSTIDCGGGVSSGGTFSITGTIGQPDAGRMTGGSFSLSGGFWSVPPGAACYPNCDSSTTPPVLNALDFACFLNRFAAGDTYANCDNSTAAPTLNVLDFACFLNRFAAGCT
mgnify:CR=1 FL=1